MALALRLRVSWADDIIEDQVHVASEVLVGSAAEAKVILPGRPGLPARFRRGRDGYRLTLPPGFADHLTVFGEAPVGDRELGAPLELHLGPGLGSLRVGGTELLFEVLRLDRERDRLRLAGALTAVAAVSMMAASSYQLVRQLGDGRDHRWGQLTLGTERARFLRVAVGPTGEGASRLALGEGSSRRPPALAHLGELATVKALRPRLKTPRRPAPPRSQPSAPPRPSLTPTMAPAPPPPSTMEPEERRELLGQGQQALLAAELRTAVDSFSRAAQTDELDYDNLNWLGLAHYFLGEYDRAAARWQAAMAMDPHRPDAINNLGGIARRRGDLETEIGWYQRALETRADDCHALNSLALALAKQGRLAEAEETLERSDGACGGGYAYTNIQRAGIRALAGRTTEAMEELEKGLGGVDTLVALKEYEVLADLLLDPAFASLRSHPRFAPLTAQYLPRATLSRATILTAGAPAALPGPQKVPIFDDTEL